MYQPRYMFHSTGRYKLHSTKKKAGPNQNDFGARLVYFETFFESGLYNLSRSIWIFSRVSLITLNHEHIILAPTTMPKKMTKPAMIRPTISILPPSERI
ncbi:MAG: hypothetical protein HYV90_05970 [Candidatus Woesebacteria bacterium]|nr:MAG: hypothetical protein HYV90_05970 [Candidatus Woesebacteria bacterium]